MNNQTKRKNKRLLGSLGDFPEGTMSIGRLDENSEGLLLLTTDGKTSASITSSKYEKEYHVQVDGLITTEAINQMREGLNINVHGSIHKTLPCLVEKMDPAPVFEHREKLRDERHGPTSWISVTIREGKFRQVRKMTAKVGFPTLRLVRVRIGKLKLGNLKPGEVLKMETLDV